jgi:Uncharacterised nucleotidyltransferase
LGLASGRYAAAVYDVLAAAVRGSAPPLPHRVALALDATPDVWDRVLMLETCGPWVDRVRRANPQVAAAVRPADNMLRVQGEYAVFQGIAAGAQLAEVAVLAERLGVRVLALKGAARLLSGEAPGRRSLSDIDLMTEPGGATALFDGLMRECGYAIDGAVTPERHRQMLVRAGALPIEIHERLTDAGSSIDAHIWEGAVDVRLGTATLAVPSPTARVLHTVQHALVVHRTVRYRLRDVTDVRTVWAATGVERDAVRQWVARQPYRGAADTLLAAAGVIPEGADRAWGRIRRVAVARLSVPGRDGVRATEDPLVYVASQLAEGSPRVLASLAWRALKRPWYAASIVERFVARARGRS